MPEPHPHLSGEESRTFSEAVDRAIELHNAGGYRGVILRGLFQAASWGVLAYAIQRHDLNWLLVLTPWILEFQLMIWLGPPLARFVVEDPVFRKNSGRWSQALLWSIIFLLPPVLLGMMQHDFQLDASLAFFEQSTRASTGNGIAIACAVVTAGLIVDTARDVAGWRAEGGAFAWPATMRLGMRLIALFVVLFVGFFALTAVGSLFDLFGAPMTWHTDPGGAAWLALTVVVLTDLGELLISALLIRKSKASPSVETRHAR